MKAASTGKLYYLQHKQNYHVKHSGVRHDYTALTGHTQYGFLSGNNEQTQIMCNLTILQHMVPSKSKCSLHVDADSISKTSLSR